jgi:hypothetical protein
MWTDLIKLIFKAWRDGSSRIRASLTVSFVLLLIALSFKLAGEANLIYPKDADLVAGSVAAVGALLLFIVLAYQASIDQQKRDERVEAAERRAEEHPQETRAAWDLARIKLEQYLDRNLKQVRSIFWLSLLVM